MVKKIVSMIFKPLLKLKYNFVGKKNYIDKKQNYLIISNHVTTLDPFIVLQCFSKPIFFVSSEEIFNKGFITKIITFLAKPIRKKKSFVDIAAVKNIMSDLKNGHNVGLFVEGNRTYDGRLCTINPSIIKLIKKIKTPIILFNIIGGYGSDPRWGVGNRKGYLDAKIAKVLTHQEIEQLSDEDLYDEIITNLTVDEFTLPYKYKSAKRAEKLERLLYVCPICQNHSTLKSNKNEIECTECGLKVEYTENLQLVSDNEKFKYKIIPEWADYQIAWLKKHGIESNILLQDSNIDFCETIGIKTKVLMKNASIQMSNKGIRIYDEKKKQEIILELKEIISMAMQLKTKVLIYIGNHTYFIKSKKTYNGIKYVQLYYHFTHIQKGENDEFLGI